MESSLEAKRRQRSRMACEPCRERKRKCAGGQPCHMCSNFGYECYYRSRPRKKRSTNASKAVVIDVQHPVSPEEGSLIVAPSEDRLNGSPQQDRGDPGSFVRSLESNSGSTFVRTFAMAVDPSNAPPPRGVAWNLFLGERQVVLPAIPRSITDVLSLADMQNLANIYFEKVDPCYGFIDRGTFEQKLRQRWTPNAGPTQAYDAVLCGVAVLGCLFSSLQDLQTEASLFALAKSLLDLAVSEEASIDSATAWILRTVYLRLTARPDEAWMSSCVALHSIDSAGLHHEPESNSHFRQQVAGQPVCTPDIQRRIFGVARHLNVWLSFDLARSRVLLQNASTTLPSAKPGDYTTELLELLPYTENLDPRKALSGADLVTAFADVLNRTHTEPPSILAQCNLMQCLYRRLYTLKWPVPPSTLQKAVNLIQRSINVVHMTIAHGSPWHQVANVPFQSTCTLLAIDTTQSFSLLDSVISCLDAVNQAYQTSATRDAVISARALIYMHQKRREADVKRQSEMLKLYPDPAAQSTSEDTLSLDNFVLSQAFSDLPWLNDLIPDFDLGVMDGVGEQGFAGNGVV